MRMDVATWLYLAGDVCTNKSKHSITQGALSERQPGECQVWKNVRYLSKIPRESTLENTVAASVTMVTDDDY